MVEWVWLVVGTTLGTAFGTLIGARLERRRSRKESTGWLATWVQQDAKGVGTVAILLGLFCVFGWYAYLNAAYPDCDCEAEVHTITDAAK